MPKSKVRKKPQLAAARTATVATTRAKVAGPSSQLYIGVMVGLMVLGLLWMVLYYLWRDNIPLIAQLGSWNFAVGFALMVAGLVMTMRWR